MTLSEAFIYLEPFVPSPRKENFQRKGTKIQTASLGPGSNARPLGILLSRLANGALPNVEQSFPGGTHWLHVPGCSRAKHRAQAGQRDDQAVAGP